MMIGQLLMASGLVMIVAVLVYIGLCVVFQWGTKWDTAFLTLGFVGVALLVIGILAILVSPEGPAAVATLRTVI